MPATPWAQYKTPDRQLFGIIPVPDGMLIAGGEHPERQASCRMLASRRLIEIMPPQADARPRTVRPYRLRLSRWSGAGVPRVGLHPFALAHLLITGQVTREILLGMALGMKDGVTFAPYPITDACELRTMLGVPRFVLAFATNFDLEVTAM